MKNVRRFLGVFLLALMACGNANAGINDVLAAFYKFNGNGVDELVAEWWQWTLETPASVNPVLDSTGEFCSEGQSGHVWFLAGTFGSGASVKRECTMPSGKSLFIPLINSFYGAFINDPPDTKTEEFIRAAAHCDPPDVLSATIDGVKVEDPAQYFEQSPIFEVQLPEDNVLGFGEDVIPELRLRPSVDEGYYLFLRPLPPGEHLIQWESHWVCSYGEYSEDASYDLLVLPQGRYKKRQNEQ